MSDYKPGDRALDRDGRTVVIERVVREDGVDFAWIRYPDGYLPHDVRGRVAGTEDDPIWEHRVLDGKVVGAGGDYWNDADWYVEKGLRPVPEPTLELTVLGTTWGASGDLAYLTHEDGREARIYVDSLGETWVDVRVIPEGGSFHTERVDSYRVETARQAEVALKAEGFGNRRAAQYAHRVHERASA